MRLLIVLLAFVLAACGQPTPPASFSVLYTPRPEVSTLYRFRFGDPVQSLPLATVTATSAEVTAAGLTIELDRWGGCERLTWTGLTGQAYRDRTRVWVDVQDEAGAWTPIFSGSLVERPSAGVGQRVALGDKYLRLKELPVSVAESSGDISDVAKSVWNADARADLIHLQTPVLTASGVTVRRVHDGESVAAALDGVLAFRQGWGWTVRADDTLYLGPPVSRAAILDRALAGVEVTERPVVSEGLVTAIQWRYVVTGGGIMRYESQAPELGLLGRAARVMNITRADAGTVIKRSAGRYESMNVMSGQELTGLLTSSEIDALSDDKMETFGFLPARMTLTLEQAADWIRVQVVPPGQGVLRVVTKLPDGTVRSTAEYTRESPGNVSGWLTLFLPALPQGGQVILSTSDPFPTLPAFLAELNPRRFDRALLDQAATDLYRLPPRRAATATLWGIHPAAGSVLVKAPGESDWTEIVQSTRYILTDPARTEYQIGERDTSAEAQTVKVLLERIQDSTVAQATGVNPV